MKRDQIEDGRISSDHFKGIGTVTREMVEKRARELAAISGRTADQVLDTDISQAMREMFGESDLSPKDEIIESAPVSDRWNPVAGSPGFKTPVRNPVHDEQTDAEKLIDEGMQEAEHERMVEATRERERRERR